MNPKVNDNKTTREECIKILLHSVLKIEVKTIMEIEKTILIEVLDNNKSFAELQSKCSLTRTRQRIILENATNKFAKYLESINEKQQFYEESEKELIELRHWKKILEANIEKEKAIDPKLKKLLALTIKEIGFSSRVQQVCYNENIYTISDLVKYSKRNLSRIRNCGRKSVKEIEDFLAKNGL
jgi:DNA-directed RNA polymerase alpha subunit